VTTRLCTAPSHNRPPVALGELHVCEDHYGDIADALTGPSAATDPTMDVVRGRRDGVRVVCGDGVTWHRARDYRPARIARDYAALTLRLTGQTTGEHVAARHSIEAPLPFDTAVAELRVDIHRTLASWVGLHVEKFNLNTAPTPSATVAQLAAFLAVHREQAAARDWGGAYADELHDLRRRARHLIDLPQPRRVAIAQCVETPGGIRCAGTLRLTPREERDTRPVSVACDTCPALYTGERWHRLSARLIAQAGRMAA
jgi:hypothetical protein